MISKEEELYTVLELLAEIGGHIGLFLGFSVWSCAGWIRDILEIQIQNLEREELKDQTESNKHLINKNGGPAIMGVLGTAEKPHYRETAL